MIIMLNHKSNLTKDEFLKYQQELMKVDKKNNSLVVFPSSIYLSLYEKSDIELGSQNVSYFDSGSHTGEVSAKQLKSLGVNYVLVGHSERRSEQRETDVIINKKIEKLISENFKIVLCVGESIDEKNNNQTEQKILTELKEDLEGLEINYDNLIVAYEPIWAIGSGQVPTKHEIEEVAKTIKSYIPVKVLYGGSVDSHNVEDIYSPFIDGFLLGKASLKPSEVQKIIDVCEGK